LDKKIVMSFAVLMVTLSGIGLVYGIQFSLSHITTGHVTITAPPPPATSGNFTVPATFTFPDTLRGGSSTHIIHVTSTINADVTLTATGGIGSVLVTGGPVTLPANGSVDITLTLTADADATLGSQPLPVTFTVTE